MFERGLMIAWLAAGCGDDTTPLVEVVAHTNAAVPAPGIAVTGYDADGVVVDEAVTDGDGIARLAVPAGGAVGTAGELVAGVAIGERLVLGPTFRRSSGRALDVEVEPAPVGVTSTDDAAGCGGSIASYAPCPGGGATDVLVVGRGVSPAPYAFALDADPGETITLGAWRTDATVASLTYVDPVDDGEAFTARLFAATAHTYAELGVDTIDVDAHRIAGSMPTGFLAASGAWAGVVGGGADAGAQRRRYQLVDGPLGDVAVTAAALPPWVDALQWIDGEVWWEPPADVSAFDVLTIRASDDDGDVVRVLPPDTQPPIAVASPGTLLTLTYEGYDTIDGYADVKARGYADVALAPMLDRARAGALTEGWLSL